MVRQVIINPLIHCLGWDMDNVRGCAEVFKYLIHEVTITIGGTTKAPDYCCRISGEAKFFLDAKRPSTSNSTPPRRRRIRQFASRRLMLRSDRVLGTIRSIPPCTSRGVFPESVGQIDQVLPAGRDKSLTRPIHLPNKVNRGGDEDDEQGGHDREVSPL